MFGKKSSKGRIANAIDVEQFDFLDQSQEVARHWVENDGPATCLIQPDRLEKPEMFGMLMVDTIRHGARAYAQFLGVSEEQALQQIWSGVDMERDHNTTGIDTVQDYERPDDEGE